ncbi:site-specific DNA-methyltransferase [Brevibacillus fluminis]|uniref:site-specific DNA-methyltransferase n=1 Tax=Brevibacillus fluminis TaxID=511487 RepID=UPI003F8C6129
MVDRLQLSAGEVLASRIAQLKELFPEAVSEGRIDWERLMQLAGEQGEAGAERYGLGWAGKKDAVRTLQIPSVATLLPHPDQSLRFDTTKNLVIEGDNLEVLKLLQKSYYGKVKMIYIDPPYNTGNDFIYTDNYRDSLRDYLRYTGQADEEGNPLAARADKSGRYHSNWLSMMYPRLFLARNLLTDDGVIFISIDEIEHAKLRLLCDEIFGEENHVADFVWQKKKGGGNDSKYVAVEHEYIVMYAKNEAALHELFEPYKPEYLARYREEDEQGRYYWDTFKRKSGKQYYPIECPDGTVLSHDELGQPISWLRSEARFRDDLAKGEVRFVQTHNGWSVQFKQRLPEGKKPRSLFLEESVLTQQGTTSDGSNELLQLFRQELFPNPKPVSLISHLLGFSVGKDDLILDFFAGSGTTGHAVMAMNKQDGGNRRFILVQLPEATGRDDFATISAITRERLRRAAAMMDQEDGGAGQDRGFKAFSLASSNFKIWDSAKAAQTEAELADQLRLFADHVVADRTAEDMLYEILLKAGIELTAPICTETVGGKTIHVIGEGELLVYVESEIGSEQVGAIIARKPAQVICLDEAFGGNDSLKTNAALEMKSHGIAFRTV